ncbi:hypothetical protein LOK49_LG07G00191 [Camellia lanceoleosa]|uniref:Uncharacterized protein n=1 Tax=Camellia lanceoleosa TaxID=1840588 RepID=A0ACC0H5W8_9ERIC|nr:hypothetical protein LOK49_LG07G00191 [Camellia lanceoleosa]
MVYSVKFRFPLNVPYLYPDAWLLYLYGFDQPYAVNGFDQPHEYDSGLRYVKKVAFYNYSHPLFFDKVKMVHFIYKVYEIRKRNPQMFNRLQFLQSNLSSLLHVVPIVQVGYGMDHSDCKRGSKKQVRRWRPMKDMRRKANSYGKWRPMTDIRRRANSYGKFIYRMMWK